MGPEPEKGEVAARLPEISKPLSEQTGCEYVKCGYFKDGVCTDPNDYINESGEPVCGRRNDAILVGSKDFDRLWLIFLEWVTEYAGGPDMAAMACYSREDMRYAFNAGYGHAKQILRKAVVLEGEDADRFLEKMKNPDPAEFITTTKLGETLKRFREDAIKNGMKLLSEDEINDDTVNRFE